MKKIVLLFAVLFTSLVLSACDKKTYTVHFDSQGGSAVASATVEEEEVVSKPADPTKEGHTFDGWYLNNQLYNFGSPVTEDLVLVAKWNVNDYKITLNSEGGRFSDLSLKAKELTFKYGAQIQLVENPTKENYEFGGWFLDKECTQAFAYQTMPAKNLDLYAKWNANDVIVSLYSGDFVVDALTVKFGEAIGDIAYVPTKDGHSFVGWEYNGELINSSFVVNGSIDLHAKFEINQYSIVFETNGGSAVETITANYEAKVNQPHNPTQEGYTFAGWYTDANLENKLEAFPTHMPLDGMTLYAKWEALPYSLTIYNGNEKIEKTVLFGEDLSQFKDLTNPSDNFVNWVSVNGTFEFDGSKMPAQNLIVVAKYEGQVVVIFEDAEPCIGAEGADIVVPADPVKLGYRFTGWYLDKACTQKFELTTFSTKDLYVYAGWELTYHDVTINVNGTQHNLSVGHGILLSEIDNLPELPEKVGYTTVLKDQNNNTVSLNDTYVTEDLVLTVDYVVNSYNVHFIIEGKDYYTVSGEYGSALSFDAYVAKLKNDVVLLNALYDLIVPIVATNGSADSINACVGYIMQNQAALLAINPTVASTINGFVTNQLGIEGFLGKIEAELSTLEGLAAGYENNKLSTGYVPFKSGYVFAGWALGENGIYEDAEGNVYRAGDIIGSYVPATTNGANTVNLVAVFRKLATIDSVEVSKESGNTIITWAAVDTSFVNTALYDATITYDIYYYNGAEYVLLETVNKNSYTFKEYGEYNIVIQSFVVLKNKNGVIVKTLSSDISAEHIQVIVEIEGLEETFDETNSGDYYRSGTDKDGNSTFLFYTQNEYSFTHDSNNDGIPDFNFTITDSNGQPTESSVANAKNHVLKIYDSIGTFCFTNGVNKNPDGSLKVYVGYVLPFVTQYEFDKSLSTFEQYKNNSEKSPFIDSEETIYTIGRYNSADLSASNDPDGKNAHIYNKVLSYKNNGFRFGLAINTFGGNSIDYISYGDYLTYQFYETNSDNTINYDKPIEKSAMGVYDEDTDSWSFTAKEGTYGVEISVSNIYLAPKQVDEKHFPTRTLVFRLDNSINVYTHQQFKEVFSNFSLGSSNVVDGTIVRGISLHSNLELSISDRQRYSDNNTSNPANNEYKNTDGKGKDGSPINLNADKILSYEGVEGFESGNVYTRATNQYINEIYNVNGNLFTLDGQKLPFATINSIENISSISGYKIANVQIAIFKYIVGGLEDHKGTGHLSIKDLQIIGNTSKTSFDSSSSASALEAMNRNSGGYNGIAAHYGSSLTVENTIISNTTIGIGSNSATSDDGRVATTLIKDSIVRSCWANCIYGWGASSIELVNSLIQESGGAAIHLSDTTSKKDAPNGAYLKIDDKTVIENFVAGTEGYFKAHNMELIAISVKGSIDGELAKITGAFAAMGAKTPSFTILRDFVDPITGIESEKFNFVFLLNPEGANGDETEIEYAHANLCDVYVPYTSLAHQILGQIGYANEFSSVHNGAFSYDYLIKSYDATSIVGQVLPYALAGLTVNSNYNGQGSQGLFMFTTPLPGAGNAFVGVGVDAIQ